VDARIVTLAIGCLLVAGLAAGCARRQSTEARAVPAPLDETALMAKVRQSVESAPAEALALADEGEQRFGDSAAAEERRALAISALINLQRIGAARSRAYDFLRRYPDGPYSNHVSVMTGVHASPAGPAGGSP